MGDNTNEDLLEKSFDLIDVDDNGRIQFDEGKHMSETPKTDVKPVNKSTSFLVNSFI